MLDFSKKLKELTGGVVGSVSENLNTLRANVGSGLKKVGGAAALAAGVTTRSSGLTSTGIESLSGTKPKEQPEDTTDQMEIDAQKNMNRVTGYASDELGNRLERLPLEERLQIAKESPEALSELLNDEERKLVTVETVEDKNIIDKAKRILSGKDKEIKVTVPVEPKEVRIATSPTPLEVKPGSITKDNLVFQESNVGNGIPYVKKDEKIVPISEVAKTYTPPKVTKPIKKIVITDPEEGQYVIDTPEKLAIANQIKAIADDIAPEYTNYLLKLAQKEGGYDHKAIRPEDQNPGGGVDRGIFQINSKFFPTVTDEMAQDIKFSVLWAISLIENGNPKKGDGKRTGQEKWIADEAVRRSTIEIE